MARDKFLLGATKDNEIVFGEFGITERNGYPEFTASFNTTRPFDGTDYDLEEHYEGWIEDMGKEYLYDLLVHYDCKPSDLPSEMADEVTDVRECLDCSIYPKEIKIKNEFENEELWYFKSTCGGQHDTRNEIEEIINYKGYNLLHDLWDKYHLKKVDESIISQVENLKKELYMDDEQEEEWIKQYIIRHYDELQEVY